MCYIHLKELNVIKRLNQLKWIFFSDICMRNLQGLKKYIIIIILMI